MNSRVPPPLNKSHNFGIFLKKGKRGVLQLDFPSQMILVIQRGHIKKTHSFNSLLYFESEEDLHISLRFLDGELDFDADTSEEKYTICRLLDLILETESADNSDMVAGSLAVQPSAPIVPHNVLKDGVLEKKGNTTITTWNRRRVKISIGEFAYFKPGEELALNVVQLRQDKCRLQRVGQNSINVIMGQRTYCFRVTNDNRGHLSVEAIRDDWIKAFEQAMTMKRTVNFTPSTASLLPPPDYDTDVISSGPCSETSSLDDSPFLPRRMAPDTASNSSDTGSQEITASVSVRFSYNQQAATISDGNNPTRTIVNSQAPPMPAKRTTIYPFRKRKEKEKERYGFSGDLVSRPHPDSVSDDLPVTALRARFTAHGFDKGPSPHRGYDSVREARNKTLNDRVLAMSDLTRGENDPKVLGKKDFRHFASDDMCTHFKHENKSVFEVWNRKTDIRTDMGDADVGNGGVGGGGGGGDSRWGYPPGQVIVPGVGGGGKVAEDNKMNLRPPAPLPGRRLHSVDDDQFPGHAKHPPLGRGRSLRGDVGSGLGGGVGSFGYGGGGSAGLNGGGRGGGGMKKASSMSDLLDVGDDVAVTPEVKAKPMAPAAPPLPAPAPPPPPMVPPPPSRSGAVKGGVKLKQVHWTPVDKNQLSHSLWKDSKSLVPALDLKLLEAMFSVNVGGKDAVTAGKSKAGKQSLVDARRAQNLGILFSGFKADTLTQLMDALSSVTETDDFQLQKMTAMKKFQPTAEDVDLFRMYRQSRDSLAPVDRFMLDLCEVPKLGMRIDLTLALWDLPNNYQALLEEVDELLNACKSLIGNSSLQAVLRCLLIVGNHLNAKRQSKDVQGFQVSSVDKMVDLKGRDPQYSLMTYLVEQLHTCRPDLLDWTASLTFVPKVADYSVRAISAEIDVIKTDVQKVKKYYKSLKGVQGMHKKFISDVQNFILEYDKRMQVINDKYERLKQLFTHLLAWLGEPPSRTSDVLFSSLALLIERFQTARARLTT